MSEGAILKEAVKAQGFTDQQFADKLSVSRQTLSTWYGKDKLNNKTKQLIKKFLDIDFTTAPQEEIELAPVSEREYKLMERIVALQQELIDALKKK